MFCIFPLCFCYQYQCNQLPEKTRLQDDLLYVEWDVKLNILNDSLSFVAQIALKPLVVHQDGQWAFDPAVAGDLSREPM